MIAFNNTRTFFLIKNRKKIIRTIDRIFKIQQDYAKKYNLVVFFYGSRFVLVNSGQLSVIRDLREQKFYKVSIGDLKCYRNYLYVSGKILTYNKWQKIKDKFSIDFLVMLGRNKVSKAMYEAYLINNTIFMQKTTSFDYQNAYKTYVSIFGDKTSTTNYQIF